MTILSSKKKPTYPVLRKKKKQALVTDEHDVVYSEGGASIASSTLMFISVLVLSYSYFKLSGSVSFEGNWAVEVTVLSILWLVAYFTCTYLHYKTVYLFTTAYIIALTLFHLGVTFQQGLGGDIAFNWGVVDYPYFHQWLALAGWYTVLALGSIGVGVALSAPLTRKKVFSSKAATTRKKAVYRAAYWSGLGLLMASSIFFVMAILSYGNLLDYTRAKIFSSSADSRGFGVFMMVFPGAVALLLLAADNKKQYKLGVILCVFAFLLFMLSGYRSAALFTSLVGVMVWVKTGRKFPAWLAIAAVIFVLLAISFAGILRTLGPYGSLGEKEITESIEQTKLTSGIVTMGQTGGVLAHVIRLVPETDPYRYGSSYIRALTDSIPNIGFKINTEYSRATLGNKAFADSAQAANMMPSDWMTYRILKEQFNLGHGTGFTTIGEAYLNFGAPGVVFFFIIIGYLLGLLDHKKIIYNPYLFIFCCSMLWPLIRTVRNDFSNFTKPAMFTLIILIIFWLASALFLGKKINKK